MADVELTSVDWLWFPYIPFGKLTIIQGNPGEGNAKHLPGIGVYRHYGGSPQSAVYWQAEGQSDNEGAYP